MRSQVRRFGTLSGTGFLTLSMQLMINLFGQHAADSFHLGKIVHAGREQPAQPAKAREQLLAPLRPYAPDRLQRGGIARLAAPGAVTLDREAMGLVADLLHEMQRRVLGAEHERLGSSREIELLQPGLAALALRHTDQRD